MGLFSDDVPKRKQRKADTAPVQPADAEIHIVEHGPYVVSGNLRLSKQNIVREGKHYLYEDEGEIEHGKKFSLCRCGKTSTPPFCDGTHCKENFKGDEIASRSPYETRARRQVGPGIDLLDDDRCAYVRFCHRDAGNIWQMVAHSDDPHIREEVIRAACDCPTGRLVAVDKETEERIEEAYEPEIVVLDDPEQEAGGPLCVKGYIPLFGADGQPYELRNRYALCRCGRSEEMPFCDAGHLTFEYWPKVETIQDVGANGDTAENEDDTPADSEG